MSREIKFRGKSTMSGKWFYGSLINDKDRRWISTQEEHWNLGVFDNFDVVPETVGQYTGLKDKNGKEIFEGDIVERNILAFGEMQTFVGEVKMLEGSWLIDSRTAAVSLWNEMHELKVIGNIHEDIPELEDGAE